MTDSEHSEQLADNSFESQPAVRINSVAGIASSPNDAIIPVPEHTNWQLGFLQMRERVLRTELNWVLAQLGKNPKRCLHCGELVR